MSLLQVVVSDGPFKGWPFEAALAIQSGSVTPAEAKRRLIERYEQQKDLLDQAIAATQALPESVD